jgi:mercuric ion transport protein
MTDDTKIDASEREAAGGTGALLLAAGGLAAAFGAASCCALPLLLGSLGLGSAWLLALAWVAAPHRIALLAIAIVCLVSGSGVLLWRRHRTASCAPTAGRHPVLTSLVAAVLSLGVVLLVLGFLYA